MSKRLKKAQDRLAAIRHSQEAILDKADTEAREPTEAELAEFNTLDTEAKATEAAIAREKQIQQWENGLNPAPADDREEREARDDKRPKFKSLGEQAQAVIRAGTGGRVDERLVPYAGAALGHGEDDSTLGGFLVQQEFMVQLMQRTYEMAAVASRCTQHPVGAAFNGVRLPHIDETSRATGSRYGGVRAYWRGEGGSVTAFTVRLGKMALDLEDMMAVTYLTNELRQDATSLDAFIMDNVPKEIAFKLDDTLISGTGSGQPRGVVSNTTTTVEVSKESGQAATTIKFENIVKMWARMWAPSRQKAVWFINQDIEPQLFQMSMTVGTGGVPVYMPANGISGSPYGTLMGRPVIPIEQCSTLGTVGDIILADYSEYLLITKGGVKQDSSMHVQFLTNEETLRWTYRCNGMPKWKSVLTPFKGTSNTLAPFVTLATRS